MYNKLPKILYLHPHTKGWSIPGYSLDGILLFTSKEKTKRYTYTDAPVHGEPSTISPILIRELVTADLPALLASMVKEGPHFGNYKTVVFNLTNETKYDGIYNVKELLKLLKDDDFFCSAEDNYEKEHFEKLIDLYDYQFDLTEVLDTYKNDFNQAIINEIVLWKVNRYVNTGIPLVWLGKLNAFKFDNEVEEKKLREFLKLVLTEVKGIRLAMASTFLRFRNPHVYQIIDERMFRVIMRKENARKKLSSYMTIDSQIDLYIAYLKKLKTICQDLNINFQQSDRILYQFDKIKNGDFN